MNFSVTIIGSGAAVPTSRRGLTSQLVFCRNRYLLIDCGEGTQIKLRSLGIKIQKIDHVFISHLHGDHYFGLVGLLSTMHLMGRVKPIHIYANSQLKTIIDMQLTMDGSRLGFPVEFFPIEKNEDGVAFEDEKISVSYFPLDHKVPTHGFRISEKEKERRLLVDKAEENNVLIEYYHRLKRGEDIINEKGELIKSSEYTEKTEAPHSFAFCSDTCYSEKIIEHIKDVDVLYHEATFTEELKDRAKSTKHSTAKDAARIAKLANAKKLLMGHISARYDEMDEHLAEAKEVFEDSFVVEDGDVIELN